MRRTPGIAALFLCAAARLDAQPYSDPGTGAGAALSVSWSSEATSPFFSGSLLARTRLTGGLGLELAVTYRREDRENGGVPTHRLEELPIQASLQLFFFTLHRVQPYLSAGGGYYFVKVKPLEGASSPDSTTENQFTFHAGGGLDVHAGRTTVLADVRYAFVDIPEVTDPGGGSAGFWQASLGVLFDF